MIQFSEKYLRDRIHACWIGKSIGGTLGAPYEGTRDMLDIHGFASKPGEPLPNDDLDLQLVWLRAVNDLGPEAINSKALGEYWLSFINPNWNEYGVCKANMRDGAIPPLSGEINNALWRNSNGAWIRTEIWACLFPAMPEKAIRMAFEDASVDHGYGEGTFAAIFTAALESAAFVEQDTRRLLEIGLAKIPENCHVSRSVKLVMQAYDDGISRKECREMILKDNEDLGWFQAPANIAYTVLGLLYGEGDFKKSLIYAVDCGDDTDCTAATAGALLGILKGMSGIPEDWLAYVGNDIKSVCMTYGYVRFPEDCTELTDCVFNLLPVTMRRNHRQILTYETKHVRELRDFVRIGEENDFSEYDVQAFFGRDFVNELASRKQYSYVIEGLRANVLVEFDSRPVIMPEGTLTGRITIKPNVSFREQEHYRLRYYCPDGWKMDSVRNLYTPNHIGPREHEYASAAFTLTAGECVEAVNSVILQITVPGRAMPILVPIQVMG